MGITSKNSWLVAIGLRKPGKNIQDVSVHCPERNEAGYPCSGLDVLKDRLENLQERK